MNVPLQSPFAVRDKHGGLLKRIAADELSAQDIRGLAISRPQ